MHENEISGILADFALLVQREFGPRLLESVYEVVQARTRGDAARRCQVTSTAPISVRSVRSV